VSMTRSVARGAGMCRTIYSETGDRHSAAAVAAAVAAKVVVIVAMARRVV
jgi:hypothetical protein